MSFGLLRTLGPVNDTVNDATIAYTLKAGELLRVGETIIIAVGSAGSGGAWVLSAADTQANTYTVDAIDNVTGGALAGVVSCQATTALGPGDTITVTLNTACTTKRFFARIVNGGAVVSRVDVSGANGLGGAGNTAPTVTTGLVDGVGTPSPTTDPDDYAFVVTVWNGTTILTEDSQLAELNSGHFDNPAATQVKQMAVAERQLTTAAVKTYAGSLAHSQQWAMVVVTYKPQAAAASNTLGPHHQTGPANTIGYTLAAGESINAGDTAIVHVGAAGAAGAVIASINDTQGNNYTVDDSTQNGTGAGGAAASIGSGLIQTALHAGDTITATFVGSPPNRNIVIRIVSGLVTVNRTDQTGTDSTTGTTPTVTTGIEDGVGTGAPTSQGAEYGAVCLVWDAGATLTEDAGLSSVWAGHFDYAGGSQTKQMAVSEHQFTTAGIKSFVDHLGAAQAYAMVLVTYRINVSNAATLKPVPSGLSGRDREAPPSGYQGSYSNMMFDVYWDNLQPTKADGVTPVNENALDATEVARIKGILDHLQSLTAPDGGKYTGSIRLFAGYRSPKWLVSRVGSFHYKDPASAKNKVVTVPKFWTTAFKNSWANMQQLLAAQFDNHPALSMLQLANAMTYYAEELIRHTSAKANIAEMVGGGHSWDVAAGTGTGPLVAAPGAGYSDAANQAAIKFGIDTHKTFWANTAASISFNPYDKILSESEAQAVQPGIVYGGNPLGSNLDNQIVSTDDNNLTITKQLIDYHVAQLFPTNQCVLENNSVRKSYFTSGGALITTSKMGQMYDYMRTRVVPLYYQLAGASQLPDSDFNFVMTATVGALKANAVEPTRSSGTSGSPYDATNLTRWDAALRANPVPINDIGPPPPPTPPIEAMTTPVVGTTTATLKGTINPNGLAVTDYHFEYGTTSAYGTSTAPGTLPSGTAPVAVSAAISGLAAATLYHARLVATNSDGTTQTIDYTFTTGGTPPPPPTPPIVAMLTPTVAAVTATLKGTVNPNGLAVTDYHFEYGLTSAYGTSTTVGALTTGTADRLVSALITGLTPSTLYHARLVATNSDGTSRTTDYTFTTGSGTSGRHAPNPTASPTISILSGTAYTPGTQLQTDMGVFDGGLNGVDHYVASWYRVDPATGLRTLVRGPTTHTLPSATDNYTLVVGDIADQIESEVIADNADGTSAPATSDLTPTITSPATGAPVNTSLPQLGPHAPYPGQDITASHGAWTNGPISYTYRFDISMDSGGTWVTVQAVSADNTYTTKNDGTQDGGIFRVRVVANNGTPSAAVFSLPTAPLTGLPPIANPFGGPVDLPGWAFGESMPAWFRVDGVEIANWARTYEYLSSGLAGGSLGAGMDCVCSQLYDPDSTGTPLVFLDPVQDAAPWYDPQRAESIQFLGLIVTGVQVVPQTARTAITVPGRFGGSVLSPQQTGGMQINVTATLVAASKSGADYGLEWLRGVLSDPECDVCGTSTVEMRLACPPDDDSDDELGYWIAYRAGVTAGPTQGTQDVLGNLTDVAWTWTSAEAYLYKPSSPGFPAALLDPAAPGSCIDFDAWLCGPGVSFGCYTLVPPNRGAWGTIITLTNDTVGGVGQILFSLYTDCPPGSGSVPVSELLVVGLDIGEQLVIDSSQHTVTHIDTAGNVSDGLDHIYVPAGQPLEWIEVRDCDPVTCVCISTPHPCSGGHHTTVELDVQYRRRG